MKIKKLALKPPPWISENGKDNDVIISLSAQVKRNIADAKFPSFAKPEEFARTAGIVEKSLRRVASFKKAKKIVCDIETDKMLIAERCPVSADVAGKMIFIFPANQRMSAVIGCGDYITVISSRAGFDADAATAELVRADGELGKIIPYSHSANFGFLTASPENCGSGFSVSARAAFNGLVKTARAPDLANLAARFGVNLTAQEGCALFTAQSVPNPAKTPGKITADFCAFLQTLISAERNARETIFAGATGEKTKDELARSYGILKTARIISSEEAQTHLLNVRLAEYADIGIKISRNVIDELLVSVQPMHTAALLDAKKQDILSRDALRADVIKNRLNAG